MAQKPQTPKIGLILLVLLMTGAIDNIRNLPATATSGTFIFFFFAIAAIFFLIPVAMVSAELSSNYTQRGEEGIYGWVKTAFGPKTAMLAIWFQWINTMIWYPSILTFIAGTTAFLISPDIAQHKGYIVSFVITTFWIMTWINLKGLRVSAQFASFCTLIGMIIPMILIIVFAIAWLILGNPTHIAFTQHNLIPNLSSSDSWMGLTAIITSFLGLELATVHVRSVNRAKAIFPLALAIATVFMLITMILGALAVNLLYPVSAIDLVNGTILSFKVFLTAYHLAWVFPVLVIMVIIGSIGSMVNWIISPAKGLLQAADSHFLPGWLDQRNAHGVPQNIMIMQATLVTLICFCFIIIPSINGSYWLLTALSTEIYILMYMMMFAAAFYLKFFKPQLADKEVGFIIPGGKMSMLAFCLLGLIGTGFTFIIGFRTPEGLSYTNWFGFQGIFTLGLILATLPVLPLYWYRSSCLKSQNKPITKA
ncbi:MAG: APC family permease [Francisellaceae bacterium]